MRSVQLAKVAAKAESLRLRRLASRTATRLLIGFFAVVFLLAAMVAGHVALGIWLTPRMGALDAMLVIAAGDLVIALVLIAIAALNGPGRIEREALQLRETAWVQFQEGLTVTAMVGSLARSLGARNISAIVRYFLRMLGGRR